MDQNVLSTVFSLAAIFNFCFCFRELEQNVSFALWHGRYFLYFVPAIEVFIILYYFFLHKKFTCIYNLFCCFYFLRKQVPQLYKHMYPQSHWYMKLTVLLYQVILSFCCLIVFYFVLSPRNIFKKSVKLEKMFVSSKVKSFCITVLYSSSVWIENHWWSNRLFIKK